MTQHPECTQTDSCLMNVHRWHLVVALFCLQTKGLLNVFWVQFVLSELSFPSPNRLKEFQAKTSYNMLIKSVSPYGDQCVNRRCVGCSQPSANFDISENPSKGCVCALGYTFFCLIAQESVQ